MGFNVESDDPSARDDHPRTNTEASMKVNNNVGSLNNFHPYLLNVISEDADAYRDDILNRRDDPGAGAFSYRMGEKWFATRDVEAGEEFFNDYSEGWFVNVVLGEGGRDIPRRGDYVDAATAVHEFLSSLGDARDGVAGDTGSLQQEGLNELRSEMEEEDAFHERALSLVPQSASAFESLVSEARERFEKEEDYFDEAHERRDKVHQYAMAMARRTITLKRTVEWIETNGRCLDNIVPGISTIPQAGQGAFANRAMKEGDIVVPVPTMLVITDKSTLDVYDHILDDETSTLIAIGDRPVSKQLLLNYCFGHEESALVLCPATNANLINHCSSRRTEDGPVGQCRPNLGPNAVLRWSTEFDPETSEWLDLSLDEIDERVGEGRRGLSLEIAATRDIARGDEIFIDYGRAWEEKWRDHVDAWKPPPMSSSSTRSGKENEEEGAEKKEEEEDDDDDKKEEEDGAFVPISTMNRNMSHYLRPTNFPDRDRARLGCYHERFWHPCEVLGIAHVTEPDYSSIDLNPSSSSSSSSAAFNGGGRRRGRRTVLYDVIVRRFKSSGLWENGYKFDGDSEGVDNFEISLPAQRMRFFPGAYSSDQHLIGTFRHEIGVPDSLIWPERWKNVPYVKKG
uniref:SET domain-containing protein n=1 Tax=Odontella aurita TaxID=265563 RepID=A0A7S4MUH8_9STRA